MKVVVSDGFLESREFPARQGLRATGAITSRPGLPPERGLLDIWSHDLAAGAAIELSGAAEDHAFYLLKGTIEREGVTVEEGGAVCVGKNGVATLRAGAGGAALLHYLGDAGTRPDKPGGCVHILPEKGMLSFEDCRAGFTRIGILYADSNCPTCSVWLHKQNNQAGKFTFPHCHSADEVITILEGQLLLGTRTLEAGANVAVAKNAFYSFTTGPSGLVFLNFRQEDPTHLKKGEDPSKAKNEREMWVGAAKTTPLRVLSPTS